MKIFSLDQRKLVKASGQASLSVSICGSYNKHLKEIKEAMSECKRLGIQVLIPKYAERKYSRNRFVYLRGETGSPKQLQEKNFWAITRSNFVLVVNPNGYVGPSTAMEIGFSIAKGIPIFCTENPVDYVFRLYTEYGKPLAKIKSMILAKHGIELMPLRRTQEVNKRKERETTQRA